MPVEKNPHTIYAPQGNTPTFRTHSNRLLLKNIARNANKETGGQKALTHFANMMMVGTYINTPISYPTAITVNAVAGPENVRTLLINGSLVLFTWTDNSGMGNARNNDKVILTAWFPALKKMVYMLHTATRGNKSARVQMTAMRGFVADTWIGFVSHDEKEVGDSVYAGRILL
jgi:hypothetical protein